MGRRRERAAILDAFARADTGHRTVLHLVGDAGMGKSTLLDGAVEAAATRGFLVLRAGLTAAETGLSWAGLATLLRRVDPAVVHSLPAVQRRALATATGEADGTADALLVAVGLTGVLGALTERSPVCMLIDDLHWLDQATAGALAFAIRSLDTSRIVFLLASRAVALPVEPDRLVPSGDLVEIRLEGLSVAGIRALLAERCGVELGRVDLIGLHTITSGNPMHTIEVGRLVAAGHSASAALLPPSLQAAVAARLALLPPAALGPLRAAALSATPRRSVLTRLFPPLDVTEALTAGERAEVLRMDGDDIAFRHPTIVAGLLDGMGSLDRRELGMRLAAVLDDEEERAVVAAAAAVVADADIAAALERAAVSASRRGALHLAAQHARRSWELTPETAADDRLRRRLLTADVLLRSGDSVRAGAVYEELHDAPLSAEMRWEVELGHVISVAHVHGDRAASRCVDRLLAAADDDPGRQFHALSIATRLRLVVEDEPAMPTVDRMVAAARACGDPDLVLQAEALETIVRVITGEPADIDGLFERCVGAWGADSTSIGGVLAEVLVWTDRLELAELHLGRALAEAEVGGNIVAVMNLLDQLGDARSRAARWDDAERTYERYIELSLAAGGITSIAPRHAELAWIDAVCGRSAAARSRLDLAARTERPATQLDEGQLSARAGSALLVLGDTAAAADSLLAARARLTALGVLDVGALPYQGDLVDALLAQRRTAEAAEIAAQLRDVATRSQRPRARAEAGRAGAVVAAALGDHEAAESEWAQATTAIESLPLPFEHARMLLIGGVVARRAGRRSDARARLAAARDGFARLGAVPFVDRADAELARCGHEPGDAGALTPTEQRIADLVALGQTNAEIAATLFISVRTVESNLTRTYRKLGVRSRTELSRRLRERDTG